MKLPAMPVRSGRDATMNFDKLAKQIPTFVSSLPSQPTDGQEIYLSTPFMAARSSIWHLRYLAATGDAYKWWFLGGVELYGSPYTNPSEAEVTTSATPFVYKAAAGGALTIPVGGYYMMSCSAGSVVNRTGGSANTVYLSAVDAGNSVVMEAAFKYFSTEASTHYAPMFVKSQSNALPLGVVITPAVASSNASQKVQLYNAQLMMYPIRIG